MIQSRLKSLTNAHLSVDYGGSAIPLPCCRHSIVSHGARIISLLTLVLLMASLCSCRSNSTKGFIIIMMHGAREDHFPASVGRHITTPYLDRLVSESIQYTRAYTNVVDSTRSLASLWSGYHYRTIFIGDVEPVLPWYLQTLPSYLHSHQIRTGCFYSLGRNPLDTSLAKGCDYLKIFSWKDELSPPDANTILQAAAEWLSNIDEKFFLFIQLPQPGFPDQPHNQNQGTKGSSLVLSPSFYLTAPQKHQGPTTVVVKDPNDLAQYDRKVSAIDKAIGWFLEGLRKQKLWDKTWLAVTSDHGLMLPQDPVPLPDEENVTEVSVRVPLILHPANPKGRSGITVPGLVYMQDLFPTIFQAFQIPIPAHTDFHPLPVAFPNHAKPSHPWIITCASSLNTCAWIRPKQKFIYTEGGKVSLYRFPFQESMSTNIAPKHPQEVKYMTIMMKNWILSGKWQILTDETAKGLQILKALGYIGSEEADIEYHSRPAPLRPDEIHGQSRFLRWEARKENGPGLLFEIVNTGNVIWPTEESHGPGAILITVTFQTTAQNHPFQLFQQNLPHDLIPGGSTKLFIPWGQQTVGQRGRMFVYLSQRGYPWKVLLGKHEIPKRDILLTPGQGWFPAPLSDFPEAFWMNRNAYLKVYQGESPSSCGQLSLTLRSAIQFVDWYLQDDHGNVIGSGKSNNTEWKIYTFTISLNERESIQSLEIISRTPPRVPLDLGLDWIITAPVSLIMQSYSFTPCP